MALDGDLLGTQIVAAIKTEQPQNGSPAEEAKLLATWQKIGNAIVDHITSNAIVNTTGTVTSGAGSGGSTVASGTVT